MLANPPLPESAASSISPAQEKTGARAAPTTQATCLPKNRADRLALFLATGGGAGRLPQAPGTWGAAVGLALATPMLWLPWWGAAILTSALILLGVPICRRAARLLGRKDPPQVVWDELATVPLVFVLCPVASGPWWWQSGQLVLGFALHRLFDIAKPPPVRNVERLPAGWGIMADDCVAAAYAAAGLFLLRLAAGYWLVG